MSSETEVQEPQQTPPEEQQSRRRPRPITILLSLLALIAFLHYVAVSHPDGSSVSPADCTQLLRTTDYTQVVHLQPASQQMEAIQLVNQLTGGQPAALIQVANTGPQQELDVYIYGCMMQQQTPTLKTLFTQHGLVQGTVSISQVNTLITGELDTKLVAQNSILQQPLQQNIYHEYAWQNDSFVQIAFPGLYPVVSRNEAEQLQQQANAGQPMPWSDPLTTAEQMAKDILKWSDSKGRVLNNNGTIAQMLLVSQHPHLEVTVTLARLIQHNSTGLWFVTSAKTPGLTLKQPQAPSVTSPITIRVAGALAGGQTTATIFDHTLTPMPSSNNVGLNIDAKRGYAGSASYKNIVPNQQGLLLVQSLPKGKSTEAGRLLLIGVILG